MNKHYVSFDGVYDDGETYFISSGSFNGMLNYNKKDSTIEYVTSFQNQEPYQGGLHHKVYKYEDNLVFTPNNAKGIHIYDTKHKKMYFHKLFGTDEIRTRCIDALLVEDKLWLFFAYAEKPVVIFDLNTYEIKYFYGIIEKLPMDIRERKLQIFWCPMAKHREIVCGAIWNTSYIVKINMITQQVELCNVGEAHRGLSTLAYDGMNFWFARLRDTSVYKWNEKDNEIIEYESLDFLDDEVFIYNNIICEHGQVLVIPNKGKKLLCVDEKEKKILEYCSLPDSFAEFADIRKTYRRFYDYDVINSVIRLFPANANMMVEVDVEKKISVGTTIMLDVDDDENYKKHVLYRYMDIIQKKGIITKSNIIGLKEYLGYLTCDRS